MTSNIQLSPNFDLRQLSWCINEELSEKNYIYASDEKNNVLQSLKRVCVQLEVLRLILGKNLTILKGVVSPEVNNQLLESSLTSPHMEGLAVDFTCEGFGTPYEVCHKILSTYFLYDQLYYEKTFIHLGFRLPYRMLVLSKVAAGSPYVSGIR